MAGPFLAAGKSDRQTIAVNTPEDARQAVDAVKKRGVDFVKILSVSRESYFAVADESAKQAIPMVGHVPYSVSVREAAAAGQKSIEHLTGILLACSSREDELRAQGLAALAKRDYAAYQKLGPQIMSTYDPDKAGALFLQLAKSNTWQVPTLVWTEANSRIDDADLQSDPRLKYVPASVRGLWDPAKLREKTSPEELAALKAEAARDLELVKAMHGAGVRFMAGSDGPDPYVFPGFSLHDELEWLVKSGFTPLQALQSATFNPALFMSKMDKYGVVELQRAADLVLSGSSLGAVPAAIAIARRTRRIVRQNLAWAFGYNLLALPLAAAGMVTPWLAALGMALSSLAVTANSLRLAKQGPRGRTPR